ncbi:NADPH oxidase organizer 1a [Pholidichthys leucotaenia]
MEGERYPISVRFVGVLQKGKTKLYIASVLWSDQNEILIYRTFREFKKMHKQLKKIFSPENKLKTSDRILPRFRDKMLKQKGHRKSATKSLLCLRFLQKYCNELLSCDLRVSQSPDLIQLFSPKEQDLQPEFAKDGVMITISEDEVRRSSTGGSVTQPFVTETYQCVAPYETKDTKNKPFKVAVDEKVDVLIKDKAGWWLVEKEDKQMAWFPAPYLERLNDDDADDETEGTPERGMLYTAVKNYKATKNDEISVPMGAVVEVTHKSDNGWWLIRYNEKEGYIPSLFLQPTSYLQSRMAAQDRIPPPLLVPSSSGDQQPQLRRFPETQLHLPTRSPSPHHIKSEKKQTMTPVDVPPEAPPVCPAVKIIAAAAAVAAARNTAPPVFMAPPPAIMVEMDGEEPQRGQSLTEDSERTFISDSDFSDSDEFGSFSDSSITLSSTSNDERLRLSHTPPPMSSNCLSPTDGPGRLMPSISDPNLYKGPATPKVPPRPKAQEILARCSTITRKNAAREESPTQTEVIGR